VLRRKYTAFCISIVISAWMNHITVRYCTLLYCTSWNFYKV